MAKVQYLGTGRRKSSVARVRLVEGTGKVVINKKPIEEHLVSAVDRQVALTGLTLVGKENSYDVFVNVNGGGTTGQAGAIRLGIARALLELDGGLRKQLKEAGLLTRDARVKERRKYGLKKARKAPQFSKR